MTDNIKAYAEAVERAERAADALAEAKTAEEIAEAERAFDDAVAEAERRRKVLELKREQEDVRPVDAKPAELGLSKREAQSYSVVRAIRALVEGDRSKAPFEFECSDEIAKRIGRPANGFYLPDDIARRDITTGSGGSGLVTPTTDAASFIELLRAKMVTRQAGARLLTGLSGKVALPRQTGAATHYWVTEGNAVTESAPAFDQIVLTPKTGGAFVDITRALLAQSTMDVERMVIDDLATVCALALDRAVLHGSGSSGEPTGIAATSGVNVVAIGANGGAPTWSHIVQMETEVAIDNADVGALAYVTNPQVRGKLKNTPKVASTDSVMVWGDGQYPLNGYAAYVTSQVRSDLTKGSGTNLSAIFFGNFADAIVATWGPVDILVDPYTGATSGTVRVVALQDVDVAVRHPGSFSVILDAATA